MAYELSPLQRCRGWPNLKTNMDREETWRNDVGDIYNSLSSTVLTLSKTNQSKYAVPVKRHWIYPAPCARTHFRVFPVKLLGVGRGQRTLAPEIAGSKRSHALPTMNLPEYFLPAAQNRKRKQPIQQTLKKRKLGQPTETTKTSPRKTNHETFESVQNILTKFLLQNFAFCILHAGLTGMQWQFLFQFRNCSFAVHLRKFTPKHWLVNHSFRGPKVQLFWSDNEKT